MSRRSRFAPALNDPSPPNRPQKNIMKYLNLYASAAATTDNAANVEIFGKRIKGLQVSIATDFDADSESANWEVSTVPYNQINVNDAVGPIAVLRNFLTQSAAGANRADTNLFIPVDVPWTSGTRLHLNCILGGTGSSSCNVLIAYE